MKLKHREKLRIARKLSPKKWFGFSLFQMPAWERRKRSIAHDVAKKLEKQKKRKEEHEA